MDRIEIKVLNHDVIAESERMMVAMARLTQKGHKIKNMDDFMDLVHKDYKTETMLTMCDLPHPTIQKFGAINVAVVGASRRFLAQITRHQNEVKFMSGSLQYSDWSDDAQFCIPYHLLGDSREAERRREEDYLPACRYALQTYKSMIDKGIDRDEAGYVMPQGLRNVLLISATPYQWKHMIKQRTCNRNTLETQYVMLRCWEELEKYSSMFANCGPACVSEPGRYGLCPEGKMTCGHFPITTIASDFLDEKFPLLRKQHV